MDKTIENLKKIKVDALYGKKKHFNAADREQNYHQRLGIATILINVFGASGLFYILSNITLDWLKYTLLVLIFIGAFISFIQTYFNFSKQSEGHRSIGNRYLSIYKKCNRLEGYIDDGVIDNKYLINSIEEISKEIDSVNTNAESFPTNNKDYAKAQKGIKNGDESYTDDELKL